jgi:hypothetical protein
LIKTLHHQSSGPAFCAATIERSNQYFLGSSINTVNVIAALGTYHSAVHLDLGAVNCCASQEFSHFSAYLG